MRVYEFSEEYEAQKQEKEVVDVLGGKAAYEETLPDYLA